MIGEEGHAVPDERKNRSEIRDALDRVEAAYGLANTSIIVRDKSLAVLRMGIRKQLDGAREHLTRALEDEALARSGGPGSTGSVAEGPSSKTVRDERARRPGRECACGPTTTSMECPWHS